jgi:hypothetical protein
MEPELESLWQQSVPEDPASTRILFQRYRVERVKGFEVVYETGNSARKLWVLGDARRVYAPKAPLAWGRLLGVSVPAVAVAVPALVLLVGFLFSWVGGSRSPQQLASVAPVPSPRKSNVRKNLPRVVIAKTPPQQYRMPITSGVAAAGVDNERDETEYNDTPATSVTEVPTDVAVADEPATPDNLLEDATDLEDDTLALNTYDVLAGIYSNATDAQQVADELEDAAYDPTVTTTQGAGDFLRMVFIKGFWTKDDANKAVQDLKDRGIAPDAKVIPVPFDVPAPAFPPPATAASNPIPVPMEVTTDDGVDISDTFSPDSSMPSPMPADEATPVEPDDPGP